MTDGVTSAQVRENSICVIIEASRFGARRSVAKGEVTVSSNAETDKKIDQAMCAVGKELLDSDELRTIAGHDHYTKRWIKARSVPSPLIRSSAFLVKAETLPLIYDYLEGRAVERQELVKKLRGVWPKLVKAAKERLGPLWKAEEYPAASAIEDEFELVWRVVEIGTPDKKLRSISKALYEKEKKKAEETWSNAVGQITQALAQAMLEPVAHLAEKLGGGDEKPKRLRVTALQHVTEFLDTFDGRNLTQNSDLDAIVKKAKALLQGVDVKQLKDDDKFRKQFAADFKTIKSGLDKMLEDKPGRAISFSDDEPV